MQLTIWGKALESLRLYRGIDKSDLPRKRIIGRTRYNALLTSPYGPSVAVLDRFLRRMELTWQDWTEALARVRRRRPT